MALQARCLGPPSPTDRARRVGCNCCADLCVRVLHWKPRRFHIADHHHSSHLAGNARACLDHEPSRCRRPRAMRTNGSRGENKTMMWPRRGEWSLGVKGLTASVRAADTDLRCGSIADLRTCSHKSLSFTLQQHPGCSGWIGLRLIGGLHSALDRSRTPHRGLSVSRTTVVE